MESIKAEESDTEPPIKRRGSYKKYAMHESTSAIPRTTQFERKKKTARNRSTQILEAKYDEENLRNDPERFVEISEPSPLASRVQAAASTSAVTLNDDESLGSGNSNVAEPVQNYGGSDTDQENNQPEMATPEENYPKEFLTENLLIFATKLRHNLTYVAAEDVLRLVRAMGGSTSSCKATKYHWKKLIRDFSSCMTVHHICDECHKYVGPELTDILRCSNCGKVIDTKSNMKSNNGFISISLTYQLKEIFELTAAHSKCHKRREKQRTCAFEDIQDGSLYKLTFVDGMLTINFSVDGVPVFDSSGFSMYPILCSINELPPRERKHHVLLCGLWFGTGKPIMNEYLKPFVVEAQVLYNVGFTYKFNGMIYTKKCRVLAGVCDSVARPMLRNSTQFNGKHGCGLCLHEGEVIEKGRGTVRVYPLADDGNPFGEGLRTHEQTLQHIQDNEKGMKGRSVLIDIPNFDIILSLDADWMHAVPLGVCRQFAKLWFDPANHSEQFYFGHLLRDIDERILTYNPTADVSRTPRAMSDRSHWKAHEWVVFLLFYSLPTLDEFFPKKYVGHWALLVDAIQILTKTSIMRSEVVFAERSLIQFISDVEKLYGRQHVSFNVHLLAHLGKSVERLGPLWTHSAFIYEDANQDLLNYIKSSNGVAMQICDAIRTKCVVDRLTYICNDHMTKEQKRYLYNLLNKSQPPTPSLIIEGARMLGASTNHRQLTHSHSLAFERADVPIDRENIIRSYTRLWINGQMVHSKAYTRVEKRRNYFVQLNNGEIFEIDLFYVVSKDGEVSCYALGRYFERENKSLISGRRLEHLIVVKKNSSEDLVVVHVSAIKEKVMVLEMNHLQLAIACVHTNRFEVLV